MVVYADKAAFFAHGVEHIMPSHLNASEDCTICKDPLLLVATPPIQSSSSSYSSMTIVRSRTSPWRKGESMVHHRALHIISCGHMHGAECLSAWLDTGNTCPTCRGLLFQSWEQEVLMQDDLTAAVDALLGLNGNPEAWGGVDVAVGYWADLTNVEAALGDSESVRSTEVEIDEEVEAAWKEESEFDGHEEDDEEDMEYDEDDVECDEDIDEMSQSETYVDAELMRCLEENEMENETSGNDNEMIHESMDCVDESGEQLESEDRERTMHTD